VCPVRTVCLSIWNDTNSVHSDVDSDDDDDDDNINTKVTRL
jgi:hypothetical protein